MRRDPCLLHHFYRKDLIEEPNRPLLKNQLTKKLIHKNDFFIRVLINNACIDAKPGKRSKTLNLESWNSEFNVGLKAATILINLLSIPFDITE